jgi:hypothetical protein
MFNLVYRDGAPENTGHYEILDTIPETVLIVGQLVSIEEGKAAAYASGKPYGVVAIGTNDDATKATAAYDQIAVLKIDSDMIFRVALSSGDTTSLVKGTKLKVSANGVVSGAASGIAFEITEIISDKVVEGRFVDAE